MQAPDARVRPAHPASPANRPVLRAGVKANVLFFENKSASESPWTKKLWIYDLRTNKRFTLKTSPLRRQDLDEFVGLCNAVNRHQGETTWSNDNPEGRWRAYSYEEIIARDKARLDIF